MKSKMSCAGLALVALAVGARAESLQSNIGRKIDISGMSLITTPDTFVAGKPMVVENWATWCGPCIKGFPHLNELNKKYANLGVQFVALSAEKLETVRKFASRHPDLTNFPLGVDGMLNRSLGIVSIPHTVLVNREGRVFWEGHPALVTDRLMDLFLKFDRQPIWPREEFLGANELPVSQLVGTRHESLFGTNISAALDLEIGSEWRVRKYALVFTWRYWNFLSKFGTEHLQALSELQPYASTKGVTFVSVHPKSGFDRHVDYHRKRSFKFPIRSLQSDSTDLSILAGDCILVNGKGNVIWEGDLRSVTQDLIDQFAGGQGRPSGKEPNKAPEPTNMADTAHAAHEPRQP